MQPMICRAIVNNGVLSFNSVTVGGITIAEQIASDKVFGFLKPKNGIITYSITNGDDEITEKQVLHAVRYAFMGWAFYVPIKFVHVIRDGMVRIKFKSEEEDLILNKNTLAYMYYPTGGITDGIMVINKRFYWTNDGKAVNMHLIDPIHYPNPVTAPVQGMSWDLDKVIRHELGHGIFGLSHSQNKYRIMSGGYEIMDEHITPEDVVRAQAKAGKIEKPRLERWLAWFRGASNRNT